jgi:hypothetical protein
MSIGRNCSANSCAKHPSNAFAYTCSCIQHASAETCNRELGSEVYRDTAALRTRAGEVLIRTYLNPVSILISRIDDAAALVATDG